MSRFISLLLLLLVAPLAHGDGMVLGKIEYVRIHDGVVIPSWDPPIFWFTLTGVTNSGSCPGWVAGRTIFAGRTKEMLAMLLTARMTGTEVAVYYSDALLNGFCRAAYVTIGDPPPPF
jgi:hypothetical protein